MRSAKWMVAYAVVLLLAGATYAALVFVGQTAALVLAVAALVTAVVAVALTIWA